MDSAMKPLQFPTQPVYWIPRGDTDWFKAGVFAGVIVYCALVWCGVGMLVWHFIHALKP